MAYLLPVNIQANLLKKYDISQQVLRDVRIHPLAGANTKTNTLI